MHRRPIGPKGSGNRKTDDQASNKEINSRVDVLVEQPPPRMWLALFICVYLRMGLRNMSVGRVNSDLPVQAQHGDIFLQENKETPDFRA